MGLICYQCDKEVTYLFDDGRCKDCTRLTPEEVTGEQEHVKADATEG